MHDLSPELPLSCIQFRIINSFCLGLALPIFKAEN